MKHVEAIFYPILIDIDLFKASSTNTRTECEICSKLTIKKLQ